MKWRRERTHHKARVTTVRFALSFNVLPIRTAVNQRDGAASDFE